MIHTHSKKPHFGQLSKGTPLLKDQIFEHQIFVTVQRAQDEKIKGYGEEEIFLTKDEDEFYLLIVDSDFNKLNLSINFDKKKSNLSINSKPIKEVFCK